jgi:arginine/ornithine N-succinyltransferase beta subunit
LAARALFARIADASLRSRQAGRSSVQRVSVVLAGHADREAREAFVEQVSRRDGRAVVAVMLADGSDATAQLDDVELDWLDVHAGDIVRVRRSACGALSA